MKNIMFDVASRHDYIMPTREAHIDIEIYYLLKGERLYFVENKTYHLKEGSVIFIGSNCIHKTQKIGNISHQRMLLEIHPDFFKTFSGLFPDIHLDHLFSISSIVCPPSSMYNQEIRDYFMQIEKLVKQHPFGFEEEIQCLVYIIFLSFQRMALMETNENVILDSKHQKIYEVIEYLSRNMDQITSLDSLCNSLYISKSYLCHIFKEVTGMSVIMFLNTIRIRRSKIYLLERKLSIAEVAQKVGFESAARFSHLFKRFEGVSPREYCRLHKN